MKEYKENKTEEQWKEKLSPEEFQVLRKKGTERAFTGEYWDKKAEGTYVCGGCSTPLFASETKFDSGSGWPSYYQPIKDDNVAEITDSGHGMARTEVQCSACGGHLGHVFPDGYGTPTGQRYCINSLSLNFVPESGEGKPGEKP